jgi:hypothetical protein
VSLVKEFTIAVPSTLESSSPRALLEPKDEGMIILQILGTIYPTTQSNALEEVDLRNIFTCIMRTSLFIDEEEQRQLSQNSYYGMG